MRPLFGLILTAVFVAPFGFASDALAACNGASGQAQAIGIAKYNSKIQYRNVDKLRRCENPGTELNTHCDALTQEELSVAVDEYFDALNQPQGNSIQPSYRSQSSNTGWRN